MTTTREAPARSLIEGAREGDEAAWTRIVTEIGPKIRGYARARGVADADDLTQDVFVAAASQIGEFDGDDRAFRSWLFGIAYRQIVNRYRAAAKQTAPLPVTLPDPAASPEDAVVGAFEASEAIEALDVLSEVERDVVVMRVVGGLDTTDVATAVDKSPGNVRVIQSRAMEKLREELKRRGYGAAGIWSAALVADVVGPIRIAEASAIAATAATASATGASAGAAAVGAGAVGSAAAGSTVAKIAAAVMVTISVGGGTAAVTGTLPDRAQNWVSDAATRLGVTLPRPSTLPSSPADTTVGPALDGVIDEEGALVGPLDDLTATVPSPDDLVGPSDGDTSPVDTTPLDLPLADDPPITLDDPPITVDDPPITVDDLLITVDPFVPLDPQSVDLTLPLP